MAKFPVDEIKVALAKKWTKASIGALATQKQLSLIGYAMLFSYSKMSKEMVINKVITLYGRNKTSATKGVNVFLKRCRDNGIKIDEIKREEPEPKPKKKKLPKADKDDVEKAVEKLSPVLDLFNVNTKGTLALIQSIGDGGKFSQEVIIESYKVLYTLLMAKAKGETVTKKTSASYEMIDLGNGEFQKTLAKNSSGVAKVWEETQSHLPDEKAFAGALVVMEVIQTMESGNQEYLTQDEQEERYKNYLKKVGEQRIAYGGKEYTDAELIEEEE